ncbi:MAG: TRAP transporter small permease subunit [Sneathiella sp.]
MTMAGDVYASNRGLQWSVRVFGWCMLAALPIYFLNNYLSFVLGWPGMSPVFGSGDVTYQSWIQLSLFVTVIVFAVILVQSTAKRHLRDDAAMISRLNTYLVRAAFWAVFLIGLVDMTLSFLRIEGILPYLVGTELDNNLARVHFRGPYVHIPLIFLSLIIALRSRTLGFQWLALLVVFAELLIVITRFIFSYEQAFMGDLVRFWYAALFLFASAYTLVEEGHVRVDVFYAGFTTKTKGFVNALGTLFMGISLCWTILFVGMGSKTAILYSPMANFEVTQSGFGMHVKYLMAGFLAVFAITMLVQFVSYLMEAVADYLEQPGHVDHESSLTG